MRAGYSEHDGVRKLGALLEALRACDRDVAAQHVDQALVDVAVEDRLLVVAVLGETLDLFASIAMARSSFSTPRRLKTRTSTTVPKAPGRQAQGGVSDVGGLFAEDGAQKFFFRRHRAFALRRDLADEDVARLNFGADVDDAGFVEVLQRFFTERSECRG